MNDAEKLRTYMAAFANANGMEILERALEAAREEGRRMGLEEAAKCVESGVACAVDRGTEAVRIRALAVSDPHGKVTS